MTIHLMLKYKFKVLGMMNKITSITRKKIFNLLSNGYVESAILGEYVRITFNFYGTLSCVEFLTRLYNLKDMPSKFRIIQPNELNLLIALFNRGGYVLDLSTPAFDELTLKEIGLKLTEFYGKSKGKSLMAYTKEGKENDVIKLLVALFDYYSSNSYYEEERKGDNYQKCLSIVNRIRSGIAYISNSAQELEQRFSSEYMTSQISIMMHMTSENPTEAIGKAKELIESCCKTILEERNEPIPKNEKIGALTRRTMSLLKVTPNDIDDAIPAAKAMKQILGNLSAIADGLATLRNSYGSGHGRVASYKGLEERHAKLAVGSSIILVEFLWCTHERTKKDN